MSTNECPGQILIGGMHGSGKTSITEALATIDGYSRLPALSTRAPRPNEKYEYELHTREEIESLLASQALMNFDEVNGEVYAVRVSDFNNLHGRGITPVKEIHPDNFYKFEDVCENTFSVVLTNTPFIERAGRKIDTRDSNLSNLFVATRIGKMALDVTDFKSVEEAADHVVRGFIIEKRYRDVFPDPRIIDADNERAYSIVAPVFIDKLRLTTRDFHEASTSPLLDIVSSLKQGSSVLEVGAGSNWLSGAIDLSHLKMIYHEAADGMYTRYGSLKTTVNAPIRKLPFKTGEIDNVIGSLVDGMLYPQALHEISRVTTPNGKIIVTYPSRVWAQETRDGLRHAEFTHNGERVSAHSFSPSQEEIERLFEDTGIELLDFIDCAPVKRDHDYYSPALFNPSRELPDAVVSVAIGRKR